MAPTGLGLVRRRMLLIATAAGAVVAGVLAGPSSALASSIPQVATDGARATGPTNAVVEGNADPEGQATTVHADYALASDAWCTSGGASGTPLETASRSLGSGNTMISEVIVRLEGLTPSSEYCAELVATNASGTADGGQVQFATPAQGSPPPGSQPQVATDGARATGPTSAVVEGNADPEGQATTVHADYALASDAWCTSGGASGTPLETASRSLGSGNTMISEVIVRLEGLTPSSEYCAELVATNASGTAHGGQVQFATPAEPPSPPVEVVIEPTQGPPPFVPPVTAPPPPITATPPITVPPVAVAPKPPLTNAQKLARALRVCHRKPLRQRKLCVKLAHEKYGPAAERARRRARKSGK